MTGIEMVHVPYPGGAPMVTDLIAGRVQAGIDALPNSLPHIQAGALRALAVTGPARSDALPDVPTIGETVPGYEVSGWTGIGVPAGTPAEIIAHAQPRDQCRARRSAHQGAPRRRGRPADFPEPRRSSARSGCATPTSGPRC